MLGAGCRMTGDFDTIFHFVPCEKSLSHLLMFYVGEGIRQANLDARGRMTGDFDTIFHFVHCEKSLSHLLMFYVGEGIRQPNLDARYHV